INGERVLGVDPFYGSLFVGEQAGAAAPGGFYNVLVGFRAGWLTTTGPNTFVGGRAGAQNVLGNENVFVGDYAGGNNTGYYNSYFGAGAGKNQTGGSENSYFGDAAGIANETSGSQHTLIGAHTNALTDGITNATAIGAYAAVNQSNALVLGSINGVNGAAADT